MLRWKPAYTCAGTGERLYSVSYQREGRSTGISVDLMNWALKRRWTSDGDLDWPMLASGAALQQPHGNVSVGDFALACDDGPIWLYAAPGGDCAVAGYLGNEETSLTLTTPKGTVSVSGMGTGVVTWRDGTVGIEAIGAPEVAQDL